MPYSIKATEDNLNRLNEDERKEIVDHVVHEIAESTKVLQPWKNDIVTYYDLYQLVQKNKNYDGMANIFVPEILRAVETVVAKLYDMIFSQSDWFQYSGRDENEDTEGPAIALTQLVMYQCDENNFKARVMDSLRQMVITGLTVRKIGWDYQEVSRQVGYETDDAGKKKDKKKIDTIKDTWTFEPVDLLSFHISDITTPYNDLQKAHWIGEEFLASEHYIRLRTRRGWFSDLMDYELDNDISAPDTQAQQLKNQRFQSSGYVYQEPKNKVHLIERWGLVKAKWVMSEQEMKDEGYEDEDMVEGIIVIANHKAILKLERNPWWHQQKPYLACPYVAKEFELPGLGVAKIGKSLQEEINDTRNQTLDNKTLILSTMWLKSRGSGIKDKDLVIRPNGVISTNDIEGLVPLRPPVVAGVGTNMEGIAKDDLRESVGAASNLQGIAQAGVGTATEAATINQESVGRLKLTAEMYGQLVLKPMFVMVEYLNYQFYDHVKVIRVTGPTGAKYVQLKPDEIAGGQKDVIIRVSTDGTENPAVRRQQFMNFMSIIQQIPPQMIGFYWKGLDKAYGMFFEGHKLDEIIPNPGVIDPDELLTPQEERDSVLAEKAVVGQKGQDQAQFIQYHEKEYRSMEHALNPKQKMLYQKLIMSHIDIHKQEMQQQMQQMAQMQMQMEMQNQGKSGNMIDRGRQRNSTPHNQTAAPSTQSLAKEVGGNI